MHPLDLASAEFRRDPYPVYRRLRESEPCFRLAGAGVTGAIWLVTRYDDVARVLRDPRLSKEPSRVVPPERLSPLDRSMISRDPPDHSRLRALAAQAFTPRRVSRMEPFVDSEAERLLGRLLDPGEADFIGEVAIPLQLAVLGEILGVPAEEHAPFASLSAGFLRDTDAAMADDGSRRRQREAIRALSGYLQGLIDRRRREPRDDLTSALLAAREEDAVLSAEEMLGTCLLFLLAGVETTVNLVGNGVLALLRHPREAQRLREEPALVPSAVEEVLRFESPVQRATFRVATEAVEIAGRRIPAGEQVSAVVGAANRDPDRFPEADRFDVAREPNRHLSFGMGPHYCLGAALARLEAAAVLRRLLPLLPDLRLAAEPEWSPSSVVRGLRSLRLRRGGIG